MQLHLQDSPFEKIYSRRFTQDISCLNHENFRLSVKGIITSKNKNLGEWHEEFRRVEPRKQFENLDGDAVTTKQR